MTLFPDLPEPKLAPDAPTGLGRAINGGLGVTERRRNDFYPTPAEATQALLRVESSAIRRCMDAELLDGIWEPCGRGGAIARILERELDLPVRATDIVADPDNRCAQQDLLLATLAPSLIVITNPPFALASDMIEHLLGTLRVKYLALLLKTTFWSAATREGLLDRFPVARRYDMNWRLDFTGGGAPTMECSWFVWDDAVVDVMRWAILSRAGIDGQSALCLGGAE